MHQRRPEGVRSETTTIQHCSLVRVIIIGIRGIATAVVSYVDPAAFHCCRHEHERLPFVLCWGSLVACGAHTCTTRHRLRNTFLARFLDATLLNHIVEAVGYNGWMTLKSPTSYELAILGEHINSNQNLVRCVKIGVCMDYWVHRGF